MRGRTLKNSFAILDEAQNATDTQIKMFLTRIGENSKIVINGDPRLNGDLVNEINKIKTDLQIFETKYEISNLEEFDKKINYVIFSGIGNPKNFLKTLKT